MGYYVLNGELATIECPVSQLLLDFSTVNLVWTRNGSEILDTEEPRIQRKKDALWFLPAVKEDTGIYTCIMRCVILYITLTFILPPINFHCVCHMLSRD